MYIPITQQEWRNELQCLQTLFGTPERYWCYVPAGTYTIGGWEKKQAHIELPVAAFWIARFPVTVLQYARFVQVGYTTDAQQWWTPNGWNWKGEKARMRPWKWNNKHFTHATQPIIGITWYEAHAYTTWLTEHMHDILPSNYRIRLPSDAEWEIAAAYDSRGQRRFYPWGIDTPTPSHAIYCECNVANPAPIDACPKGIAACGAYGMVGNVWEWTASSFADYPWQSTQTQQDFAPHNCTVSLRGGAWYSDKIDLSCGLRGKVRPTFRYHGDGFRLAIAPTTHQITWA